MSEEEKASGISVEELMEKESLIEELVEREDAIQAKAESALKQQLKDNKTTEDIRKKAMGSLKETKKRNSEEGGAEYCTFDCCAKATRQLISYQNVFI